MEKKDPKVSVRIPGKKGWGVWRISQNLTDRWGGVNYHNARNKPLKTLDGKSGLLDRLCEQMWEESTFVVRKDGKWGILFEVEYCSRKSEQYARSGDPEWFAELRPHKKVVAALMRGIEKLAKEFPEVEFCVPHESQICDGRPAAWAFVEDGLLSSKRRAALGFAIENL